MTGPARKLLVILAGAGLYFLAASASAQQIHIHLDFDQELDQVSPASQLVTQFIQVNATLSPNGEMNATNELGVAGKGYHHGVGKYRTTKASSGSERSPKMSGRSSTRTD